MRRALLLAVGLLLAFGPASSGEPEDELKRHFLSDKTKEGDWSCYEVHFTVEKDDPAGEVLGTMLVEYRVNEVEKNVFKLATITDPPRSEEWETREVRRGSKRLKDLLGLGKDVAVSRIDPRTETLTIDGKAFECQRLTFTTTEGSFVQQNDVWLGLSPSEFHGLRLVALSTRPVSGAMRPIGIDMELRGFGREDEVQWGKRLRDLKAARQAR